MRKFALLVFAIPFLFFMTGCGSNTTSPGTSENNSSQGSVPVSLTVTDTPPTGVAVLFFQLNITAATLSPGNVSLLPATNSVPVNVTQLQTDSAFLGSTNVPAGSYTSLNLTFANPQLTIFNGSGTTIGTGASGCANNTVCQITPTASSLALTFNTSPFPVNLSANAPLALKLDIHLDTIIQSSASGLNVNLGATNGVTVSALTTAPGTPFMPLGNLLGAVQSVNSTTTPNSFTLATGDGRTFTIDVNNSTNYSNFPNSGCITDTLSCVATQQIVKAEVSLQSNGALLASQVTYVQPAGQIVAEGTILRLSTSNGSTIMDLILQNGPPQPSTITAIPFGQRISVNVPATGVTYAVDSGTYALPGGLTFTSAANLIAGQEVSVAVAPGSVTNNSSTFVATPFEGPATTTVTASGITLEPSQITGSVAAVSAGQLSFTLSTLPNYFLPPTAISSSTPPIPAPVNITVQTSGATTFTGFTTDTIQGLAVNNVVSVSGWIFSTPTGTTAITLAAQTVLDRPGPTPMY